MEIVEGVLLDGQLSAFGEYGPFLTRDKQFAVYNGTHSNTKAQRKALHYMTRKTSIFGHFQ